MKKRNLLIIMIFILAIAVVGCGKEEVEDVGGDQDEVEEMSQKLIAGTFMSAELLDLFDVNPVGVLTTEKLLPERYNDIVKIGSPMQPDLEIIASLEPDLYITDSNLKEALDDLLKEIDTEMVYLNNNSYDDVFINIEEVGKRLNKEERAREIIEKMKSREEAIVQNIMGKDAPQVLIIFGTPESFMIATPHSYTGNLVEKLGGINVASGLAKEKPTPYVPLSMETVADLNPDIILRLTHVSPEESREAFEKEFAKGFWTNLDALKNEKVYDLDPEYFGVTANLQVINALEELTKILYD